MIEDRRKIVVRAKLGFATSGVVGIYLSLTREVAVHHDDGKPKVLDEVSYYY